jgi:hypothetical protein
MKVRAKDATYRLFACQLILLGLSFVGTTAGATRPEPKWPESSRVKASCIIQQPLTALLRD